MTESDCLHHPEQEMNGRISRRTLIGSGILATGTVVGGVAASACGGASAATATPASTTEQAVRNPEEAVSALKAGNARFVAGKPLHQGQDSVRRAALAESQAPFAVILGCSDSRVVPEILFDQGLGDLFLVRVAGNTAASLPLVVGSLEYGTAVLGAVLVVVLGHENCGAVKAALEHVTTGKQVPGDISGVLAPILPAAQAAMGLPPDQQLQAATRQNVTSQVQGLLTASALLRSASSEGKLEVVGAEYELRSGRVDFL